MEIDWKILKSNSNSDHFTFDFFSFYFFLVWSKTAMILRYTPLKNNYHVEEGKNKGNNNMSLKENLCTGNVFTYQQNC